jgi:hypothetical protein
MKHVGKTDRRNRHRAFLLIFMAALVAGCDGMQWKQERRMRNFTVKADDFNDIAAAALARIDSKGDIKTLVVPSTLDPRAVAALERIHPTTPYVPPASTTMEILPAGYFLVHEFTIENSEAGPTARLEGQLGPVTRTTTAANLPDCGTIYSIAFYLEGGDWYNPSYKIETCAESRHWVPLDAQGTGEHQTTPESPE